VSDLDAADEERGARETSATQGIVRASILARSMARFRFTVARPVAVLVFFLTAMVFGTFSMTSLPLNLMPEMSYPKLTVRTEYPGAAPAEVENDVARPLEEVLGVVSGVTKVSSLSRPGSADVVIEFAWNIDMNEASTDVLEKLDSVRAALPDSVKSPRILRYDPNLDPVLVLGLSGQGDIFSGDDGAVALRRIGEREVKRLLEPVPGVAAVKIRGGLEEEILVELDEDSLRRTGIGISTVIDRLAAANVNLAGGTMREGTTRYMVRTVNEFTNPEAMQELVISSKNGIDIRLSDLGRVHRGHAQREVATQIGGADAVEIEIYKEADANIVDLAKRVRGAVDNYLGKQIAQDFGAQVKVVTDRSTFIEASIREVQSTAIMGGLLAIAVLWFFLGRFSTTAVVAVAIPLSVVMTFAPMAWSQLSLNVMSLGGLALATGMLVDNSIVVVESIHRCREEGDSLIPATLRGLAEVGMAVAASTLTTIAVFLPMVFVEGVAGQIFADLGLTVVYGLSASLIVALMFVPMLLSRQAGERANISRREVLVHRFTHWASVSAFRSSWRGVTKKWHRIALPYWIFRFVLHFAVDLVVKPIATLAVALSDLGLLLIWGASRGLAWISRPFLWVFERILGGVTRAYHAALDLCLAKPFAVVLAVVCGLATTGLALRHLDSELIPELHQGELTVEITLPVGTNISHTQEVMAPIEAAILRDVPHVAAVVTTMGNDDNGSDSEERGEHVAKMSIVLGEKEGDVQDRPPAELEAEALPKIREVIGDVPGMNVNIRRPTLFSFKQPIEVEVYAHDLDELALAASRVEDAMRKISGLREVRSSVRPGGPEVQITYDRDALARYGLDIRQVADLVRDKVAGREATKMTERERKIPVRVRLADITDAQVESLRSLVINPGQSKALSLQAVAEISQGRSPNEIRRVGQRRVAVITANLEGMGLGDASNALREAFASVDLPANASVILAGQSQEWQDSLNSLYLALGLSMFLVYVIMAAQFESLVDPLIIMISVPLAFGGVLAALNLFDLPVSLLVGLGTITLVGVVVNNAIVLVDYANQLRIRGVPLRKAVHDAGTVRLRPILMTTTTTVLGLLPMAVGLGDGAELRQPLAVTIIAGLSVSTLLTLLVVPTLYLIVARMRGERSIERAQDLLDYEIQAAEHSGLLEHKEV
jgi:HAE1 family hydrophobic/amphiphilic exporter-1